MKTLVAGILVTVFGKWALRDAMLFLGIDNAHLFFLCGYIWLIGPVLIVISRQWSLAAAALILCSQLPMYVISISGVAGSEGIVSTTMLLLAFGCSIVAQLTAISTARTVP